MKKTKLLTFALIWLGLPWVLWSLTARQGRQTSLKSGYRAAVERQTPDWSVAGLIPCKSGGRIFFSMVNFLCWLISLFIPPSSVLPQQHMKKTAILPKDVSNVIDHTSRSPVLISTCYRSHSYQKTKQKQKPGDFDMSKWQATAEHAHTLHPTESEWAQWLCCPGIAWESTREKSSHATRQGTLVHFCLSRASHCGRIFGLKRWNW